MISLAGYRDVPFWMVSIRYEEGLTFWTTIHHPRNLDGAERVALSLRSSASPARNRENLYRDGHVEAALACWLGDWPSRLGTSDLSNLGLRVRAGPSLKGVAEGEAFLTDDLGTFAVQRLGPWYERLSSFLQRR